MERDGGSFGVEMENPRSLRIAPYPDEKGPLDSGPFHSRDTGSTVKGQWFFRCYQPYTAPTRAPSELPLNPLPTPKFN